MLFLTLAYIRDLALTGKSGESTGRGDSEKALIRETYSGQYRTIETSPERWINFMITLGDDWTLPFSSFMSCSSRACVRTRSHKL